jgi:hypothetical protein
LRLRIRQAKKQSHLGLERRFLGDGDHVKER